MSVISMLELPVALDEGSIIVSRQISGSKDCVRVCGADGAEYQLEVEVAETAGWTLRYLFWRALVVLIPNSFRQQINSWVWSSKGPVVSNPLGLLLWTLSPRSSCYCGAKNSIFLVTHYYFRKGRQVPKIYRAYVLDKDSRKRWRLSIFSGAHIEDRAARIISQLTV